MKNFRRSATKIYCMNTAIFPLTPSISGLLCVEFHGEGSWCNRFKYFECHKSYVNEFCIVYSKVSDSYLGRKVLCLFQQIFACENVILENGLH